MTACIVGWSHTPFGKHEDDDVESLILKVATQAMRDICVARYEAFGTAGNASKIKAVSLEAMVTRYDSGDLDPRVN